MVQIIDTAALTDIVVADAPPTEGPHPVNLDRVVRLPDIDALLELINDGSYDDHIEAILAAGHARKRARRGVRRPYGLT